MGSELGCCANFFRALLIILNIVFGALGIAVLGIGIWAVVRENDFAFLTGNDIASGGAILIAAGVVTLIVCVIGILGGIFKNRPLLVIYAVCVVLIVVLEIVAAILVFVYQDELEGFVEERSIAAIRGYRFAEDAEDRDEELNLAIESFQETFGCCGFNNATDWIVYNQMNVMLNGGRPPACLECTIMTNENCQEFTFIDGATPVSFNTTSVGCGAFVDELTNSTVFIAAVGGVGIAFGIIEILGIIFALLLCCCITSALKQEVV